jgi:predicted deacylase
LYTSCSRRLALSRTTFCLSLLLISSVPCRAANTVTRTEIVVPDGVDAGTRIPIVKIAGARPGPTLAVIAGVHGAEYAPIIAGQLLLARLKATDIRGTVQLVLVANPPALFKRTIFYSPADWKNLNRVFPGKRDGSYAERAAYMLTTEVIEKCDFLVDLHAGDSNEALSSYAAYDAGAENAELREQSHRMALALNFPRIVRNRNRPKNPEALLYLTNAATHYGKPNVAVESGERGLTDDRYVTPIVEGVENLMRHLGMLAGPVVPNKQFVYVDSGASISSEHDGLYFPSKKAGDAVRKGDQLGIITDLFGETLATINSPIDGLMMFSLATPPVSKGESIGTIGVVAQQ